MTREYLTKFSYELNLQSDCKHFLNIHYGIHGELSGQIKLKSWLGKPVTMQCGKINWSSDHQQLPISMWCGRGMNSTCNKRVIRELLNAPVWACLTTRCSSQSMQTL